MAQDQQVVISNPNTVYWMDVSVASCTLTLYKKTEIKIAKWGTPKKYFWKEGSVLKSLALWKVKIWNVYIWHSNEYYKAKYLWQNSYRMQNWNAVSRFSRISLHTSAMLRWKSWSIPPCLKLNHNVQMTSNFCILYSIANLWISLKWRIK